MHPSRCAPAATCAVEHATNTPERVELQLLEKAKKKDKKDKLTVLMSTSHADLLINSCILSTILFLTEDPVQVVLTSTFSFFVFSFFSFSCP